MIERLEIRLSVFVALFGLIVFLPIHPRWLHPVWRDWGLLPLLLVLPLAVLLLGRDGRSSMLKRSDWPFWLLLVALSAGTVAATDAAGARRTYFYLALVLTVFYHAGKILIADARARVGICTAIAILSGSVAVFGLFESALGVNPLYEGFIKNRYYESYVVQHRPVATQFNPAALATFLLLSWPFSGFLTRQDGWRIRLVGYVSLVLSVSCLLLTFSRGALLSLLVMVAAALLIRRRIRDLSVAIALIAALIALSSLLPYPASRFGFRQLLGPSGVASIKELSRVEMTWSMLKDHPVLGAGFFQFHLDFDKYYPKDLPPSGGKTADNTYLLLLAETGLVGFLAFMIFIGALFRRGIAAYRASEGRQKALLGATTLSLIGLLVNAAGYNVIFWTAPWMFASLLFGFLAGLSSGAIPDPKRRLAQSM